ncbi:alpha/beta hydrolase family protein [Undibacterium sp. Di24W]|uniref:alpha/beta hydrolase family protein n=1 Tax=Undibacterium sp. Di24W TaxID=3413033 RepID=UPI003BF3AC58
MNKQIGCFSIGILVSIFSFGVAAKDAVSLVRQDQKTVPVISYAPKSAVCHGIAIISPGAGGSENGYEYLGEAMSSLGYLALVVGHQESGRSALRKHMQGKGLRDGLSDLIIDPQAYRGRFMDIAATKAWAQSRCTGSDSVLIGHSMGAATTMIEAGALNKLGVSGSNSFNIYIALSPQGAGSIFPQNAWSTIHHPVLTLTGTRDDELGGASWDTRTEPYMNMPIACKWLGIIDGATHMNLAGKGMSRTTEKLIVETITSFIDGIHRGDCTKTIQKPDIEIKSK